MDVELQSPSELKVIYESFKSEPMVTRAVRLHQAYRLCAVHFETRLAIFFSEIYTHLYINLTLVLEIQTW